jgi:hypothetical protein
VAGEGCADGSAGCAAAVLFEPGGGALVAEVSAGGVGGGLPAGDAFDPGGWEVGEVVDAGNDAEGVVAVGVDPPVRAAGFGVDARPGDGVPVAVLDDLDAAAEVTGPGQSFGDTVEANAGDAVVAGRGPPCGRQGPVLGFEGSQGGAAALAGVIVDVEADGVVGHAQSEISGAFGPFGPGVNVGVGRPGALGAGVPGGDGLLSAGGQGEDAPPTRAPVNGCSSGVGSRLRSRIGVRHGHMTLRW